MKVVIAGEAILTEFKYSHQLNLWICRYKEVGEWFILTDKYFSCCVAGLINRLLFDTNSNCQYVHGNKLIMPTHLHHGVLENKQKEIANMVIYPTSIGMDIHYN